MERSFAKEADAVFWCRVMCEAEPQATGVWMVAKSKGGRMLEMTSDQGLSAAIGLSPMNLVAAEGSANLGSVLTGAGLPHGPALRAGSLSAELVGSA